MLRGSVLPSSRSAARSSSIFQVIALHHIFERHGLGLAGANVDQALFCKAQIFKVIQVLTDGLAGVEGLGAPCSLRQRFGLALCGRKLESRGP